MKTWDSKKRGPAKEGLGDGISYSVREDPRARRVILKISPEKGLEVVVPRGFDGRRIPGILIEKKDWIHETLQRFSGRNDSGQEPFALPDSIWLRAVDERYVVEPAGDDEPGFQLVLNGKVDWRVRGEVRDARHLGRVMRPWLKRVGTAHLAPWLGRIGRETGLGFRTLQVRGQKSRWGSCSSRGTISLNYKLLFLPPELVRYILIHELCHTVHPNHSPRYWNLVARFEPAYRDLDRAMRTARAHVPGWAG
ncbi:MAG TPA: SprT family zinc-dependent metalloprotease [Syntrophobacteraceae bacterium]|nr:SprT family zinc-dependent metalloprotease [Syntrophobacteraceae bacterium]